MALENNNPTAEFEAMLRRHLKSGGAPVAACVGFEADTASAYLEDALGSAARTRFESHLAGCPVCRRQVIELFRLSQSMTEPVAQPSPLAAGAPVRSRWRSLVTGRFNHWFDLSAWHWNWRLTGLSAMAGACLLVIVLVQPWREMGLNANQVAIAPSASRESKIESVSDRKGSVGEASPAASPESAYAAEAALPAGVSQPEPELRTAARPVPVPKVDGVPSPSAQNVESFASLPSNRLKQGEIARAESHDLAFGTNGAAPPTVLNFQRPLRAESTPVAAATPTPSTLTGISGGALAMRREEAPKPEPQAAPAPENRAAQETAEAEISPRFDPSSEDNPMRDATRERRRAKSTADKDAVRSDKPGLVSRIVVGLLPGSKEENKEEAAEKKAPDSDPEKEKVGRLNALVKRVHDKIFRYERSKAAWVDQDYRPETMAWRGVIGVEPGSKEYERIVKEEPALKEFFNVGRRVIVVWKNKIYRIVGN